VDEDAEPRPLTHYGKSNLEAERLVRVLAPDAVIVRPQWFTARAIPTFSSF